MTAGAQHVAVRAWAWSVSLIGFVWTVWGEYPLFTPTDRVAGWLMALAFPLTAITPSILLHIRTRSADRRAEREDKFQRHDLNNRVNRAELELQAQKLTAAREIERLKKANAEKDAVIADLMQQVAENRQYQNQTRERVHLAPIPPGPVDQRLSESGQFPVVPEATD